MRAPLLVLIAAYAIALTGLVLVPGVDPEGRPWRMGFFHAFYVLSYTATTIGFGELPHPFSDAQRLWMTFSIYLTVVAWLYAIGKIIALLQDPAFQRVIETARFRRGVQTLTEPFVLVVGYGEAGRLLVDALDHRGWRAVVLDIDPGRIAELDLADLRRDVVGLAADARQPQSLADAGLGSRHCAAVAAVTADDGVNLAVALAAKLERPKLPVVARCATRATAANLESFGTDFVVNALELFALRLELALASPSVHLLSEWLIAVPGAPLREPVAPPRGLWIVCGFGRFGRAVVEVLERNACTTVVIEPDPAAAGHPQIVRSDGTGADALGAAGVREAVAIVAGTPNDVNNCSIAMTARSLNPKLFVVIRQNRDYNAPLVARLAPSFVVDEGRFAARAALEALTMPLLTRFLQSAIVRGERWANELIARLAGVTAEVVPEVWSVAVTPAGAPGAWQEAIDERLALAHLLAEPRDREARIDAVPLLLARGEIDTLAPGEETPVAPGDQLLFAGTAAARRAMLLGANNRNVMRYLVSGTLAQGALWSRLRARGAAAD
jgi:Trk K+ transport system NAD-binding subunit